MSVHLRQARLELELKGYNMSPAEHRAYAAMWSLLRHLEAQEQSQQEPEDRMRQIFHEEMVRLRQQRPPLSNVLTSEITPESLERLKAFAASSPTTESPTTADPSAAATSEALSIPRAPLEGLATVSIGVQTPLSVRLLGVLTAAERTHVAQCSECWGPLVQLQSSWETHVQAVHGTTSTSAKPASKPSVDSEELAASPSAESSDEPGDRGQAPTETPNPAASGPAGKCGAGNHYFTLYNDRCDCGWVDTASRPTESHDDPGLLKAALASLDEWEQWEADVIMDNACWGKGGMAAAPALTPALWDRVAGMQVKRFAVMNRLRRELLSSHE